MDKAEIATQEQAVAIAIALSIRFVATSSYIYGMISVGIRELKNNLSRYLKRVEAGERIAITDRGKVVAELGKPLSASPIESRLDDLIAAGLARPPIDDGPLLEKLPSFRLPRGTALAWLDEDRGER